MICVYALLPFVIQSILYFGVLQEIIVIGESQGCRPFSSLLADDGKSFPENVDVDYMKDMAGALLF